MDREHRGLMLQGHHAAHSLQHWGMLVNKALKRMLYKEPVSDTAYRPL